MKKALWWAFWLFWLFLIVSSPETAASFFRWLWCAGADAVDQLGRFLTSMTH